MFLLLLFFSPPQSAAESKFIESRSGCQVLFILFFRLMPTQLLREVPFGNEATL